MQFISNIICLNPHLKKVNLGPLCIVYQSPGRSLEAIKFPQQMNIFPQFRFASGSLTHPQYFIELVKIYFVVSFNI